VFVLLLIRMDALDDGDDVPQLPADTLRLLDEFATEKNTAAQKFKDLKLQSEGDFAGRLSMEGFSEDGGQVLGKTVRGRPCADRPAVRTGFLLPYITALELTSFRSRTFLFATSLSLGPNEISSFEPREAQSSLIHLRDFPYHSLRVLFLTS